MKPAHGGHRLRCSIVCLIPCLNATLHLPRLFEGVGRQTRPFDEVLCYDDGSTDGTAETARRLGATVLRNDGPPGGPAAARNRLAEATDAEWLHFHDADDLMEPRLVERMLAVASPDVDIIVCQSDWVREETGALEIAWRYDGGRLAADPVAETIRNPISLIAVTMRRATFLGVGGLAEEARCWEDGDFFVRAAAAGARFHVVDEVLVKSLRHDQGASRDQTYCSQCRLRFLENYERDLGATYAAVIAEQAERVMTGLYLGGDLAGAKRAMRLCRRLGHDVPASRSRLLNATRRLIGPWNTFRLQHAYRQRVLR